MRTPSLALAATLCCVPALAAADPQPDLAARFEAEHPWSVGLRSGYTTIPNMILGGLYTRYMPVNGWFLEGVGARKIGGFTLYTSLAVTRAQADTGIWQRDQFKTPNEVSLDIAFLSAEALFDWEVPLHKVFGFHFGAGVGLGFLFGTISSKECQNLAGACIYTPSSPTRDRKAEDGWPIYPVLHLVAGVRFHVVEKLFINVDFDFRNAFGFGIGVFYTL